METSPAKTKRVREVEINEVFYDCNSALSVVHTTMTKNPHFGSSPDSLLAEDGTLEAVAARAIKRVIARQLRALMQDEGVTKVALASKMQTSRSQLDRLLDPENDAVTLDTLVRAAQAVGRRLRLELV